MADFSHPPAAHPKSGEEVLECVYADPGSNSFYYREKMPDSVAQFVRVDVLKNQLPDEIDIYCAIKASGARKHIDIARVIAKLYSLDTPDHG